MVYPTQHRVTKSRSSLKRSIKPKKIRQPAPVYQADLDDTNTMLNPMFSQHCSYPLVRLVSFAVLSVPIEKPQMSTMDTAE